MLTQILKNMFTNSALAWMQSMMIYSTKGWKEQLR
ncbi:unknown [Roseburia sp. CAG:380]|nr:unknown [Roseburia sp. CAG:380]